MTARVTTRGRRCRSSSRTGNGRRKVVAVPVLTSRETLPAMRPVCFSFVSAAAGPLYEEAIAPGIEDAGFEPSRVTVLDGAAFDRMLLAERALFDLNGAGRHEHFACGARSALRPHTTLAIDSGVEERAGLRAAIARG